MALSLRLGPSQWHKGIFAPGNCGGWLQLVPRAKRGWGVCSAGWLNLLSGRWAAQGPFSPWRLFLTLVLFSSPQQWVLGLTALLRSWSLRDCAASITVELTDWTTAAAEVICRAGGVDDGRWGSRGKVWHVPIIYQDCLLVERETFAELSELWVVWTQTTTYYMSNAIHLSCPSLLGWKVVNTNKPQHSAIIYYPEGFKKIYIYDLKIYDIWFFFFQI